MFKFQFKNLGPLKEASIDLSPLTIICGRNNVGKTYISHKIYESLKNLKKFILNIDGIILDKIEAKEKRIDGLSRVYNIESHIKIIFSHTEITNFINQKTKPTFIEKILEKTFNLEIQEKNTNSDSSTRLSISVQIVLK
ncbi:AAA family ATPase [Aquaspirillum serpens]|uniref:AAA family ATPase n=1 Tax=Aquaspirillum serpens TaxID=190 RepID=UPI0003B5A825|nr:AAA family ATPase [Aquaspirillum serpens]